MSNNSNMDKFELKYKEELSMDTPDLWSRIDEKISSSDNSGVEEINYFNEDMVNEVDSELTRKVNKKVLISLAACFCIAIISILGYQTAQLGAKGISISDTLSSEMNCKDEVAPTRKAGDSICLDAPIPTRKAGNDVDIDDNVNEEVNSESENVEKNDSSGNSITESIEITIDMLSDTSSLKQIVSFDDLCRCNIYISKIQKDEQLSALIEAKLITDDISSLDEAKHIYITASDEVLEKLIIDEFYEVLLEKSDEEDFYIIKSARDIDL